MFPRSSPKTSHSARTTGGQSYRRPAFGPAAGPRYRTRIAVLSAFQLLGLIVVILTLSSCSLGMKPAKDFITGVSDWVVIPVFFATNRVEGPDQTKIDFLEEARGQHLTFGVRNVAVPLPVMIPLEDETIERMNWKRLHTQPAAKPVLPVVQPGDCRLPDRLIPPEEIVRALAAHKEATASNEAILFVHGCCATFETSIQRAANLAAHCQRPVLIFDWVSPRGFKRYLENETRVHQTIDEFYRFLDNVETVSNPENLIVLGHSMGAQFVDQAMVRRTAQSQAGKALSPYRGLILSNADVDARSFLNHARDFAANSKDCRFYISRDDDRLNASSMAHGGFPRLGAPGELLDELAASMGNRVVDITDAGMGHELPFWVVASFARYGNLGPVKNFSLRETRNGLLQLVSADRSASASHPPLPSRQTGTDTPAPHEMRLGCCRQ